MTHAQILRADGTRETITPKNGQTFAFVGEAYNLIRATMIQICPTHDGRRLLVDEDGKMAGKPVNVAATALYAYGALTRSSVTPSSAPRTNWHNRNPALF